MKEVYIDDLKDPRKRSIHTGRDSIKRASSVVRFVSLTQVSLMGPFLNVFMIKKTHERGQYIQEGIL